MNEWVDGSRDGTVCSAEKKSDMQQGRGTCLCVCTILLVVTCNLLFPYKRMVSCLIRTLLLNPSTFRKRSGYLQPPSLASSCQFTRCPNQFNTCNPSQYLMKYHVTLKNMCCIKSSIKRETAGQREQKKVKISPHISYQTALITPLTTLV